MEKNPLLLLPDEAKDFFNCEFGAEAPIWEPRLAFLFHRTLKPWAPMYRQARQELNAIKPALQAAKKAADALRKCSRGGYVEAKSINFETSLTAINQTLTDAIKALEAAKRERYAISRAMAPVGNRDKGAIAYAEMLALVFLHHDEPVTFGQDQFGSPSTRYGRVVEYGLAFNGFESHWRRPAEEGFRTAKKGLSSAAFPFGGLNTKPD